MDLMIQQSTMGEAEFSEMMMNKNKTQQQIAYEKEFIRNDKMKQKLLEEYNHRLQDTNLSQADREALLAELHAKTSHINDLAAEEQESQNLALSEMLQRRKVKKEKLQ
jgi:predicted XRE-type DNA-binding protein